MNSNLKQGFWKTKSLSEMNQNESMLFYAFATEEQTELVFKYANEFNETQKTLSKIHVVVLNVEKSN